MDNFVNIVSAFNSIAQINEFAITGRQMPARKVYKERCSPFIIYNEAEFKNKYRFKKETVRFIISLISSEITKNTRGGAVSAELQVLVAIRSWARSEVQDDAGDLHGLSQPTVSRICSRVARAIARLSSTYIKMPSSSAEQLDVMNRFKAIKNFPNVIGAIDCTHIKIKKNGGENAQYFINRKGYYSLNVQVVCDAKLKIRDIISRWRGSTHDSRIYNESCIKDKLENNEFYGRLLGDSGYACTGNLFTPILNPRNVQEERYNAAQIATRNTVERCFGVWKQRFRCLLRGLTVSLDNSKILIVALAVLHNIAIDFNDNIEDTVNDTVEHETAEEHDIIRNENNVSIRGNIIRANFIRTYF